VATEAVASVAAAAMAAALAEDKNKQRERLRPFPFTFPHWGKVATQEPDEGSKAQTVPSGEGGRAQALTKEAFAGL
jgi:hypothetical protein